MRIGDYLYLALGVRFSEVDLRGDDLPEQYEARIEGFYLVPAEQLARNQHAFASGLLLVAAIDATARLQRSERRPGQRFESGRSLERRDGDTATGWFYKGFT